MLALLLCFPSFQEPPAELLKLAEEGTIAECQHAAIWLLEENENRLLGLTDAQKEKAKEALRLPDSGVMAVMPHESLAGRVVKPEYCSRFSFAEETHRAHPDELDLRIDWGIDADFRGGRIGLIAPIGEVALADLPTEASGDPGLESSETWDLFWREFTEEEIDYNSAFRNERRDLTYPQVPQAGQTYLLRIASVSGPNHLVALRSLGPNDQGAQAFAWRMLHRWPRQTLIRSLRPEPSEQAPDSPAWLWEACEDASVETIEKWIDQLRTTARERFLTVPLSVRTRYREVISDHVETFGARSGFTRLYRRPGYVALFPEEQGAVYVSFTTGKVGWSQGQLGLGEAGHLSGPFAGNMVMDLGETNFEELRSIIAGDLPRSLAQHDNVLPRWDLMWGPIARDGRAVVPATEAKIKELGLRHQVLAKLGHSYLYRNTADDDVDQLTVLTLLSVDDESISFAWRVLKSFPKQR